jgi:hypothetical protein
MPLSARKGDATPMDSSKEHERSELIAIGGVQHAPENEAGVILLFAKLHKKIGFPIIDRI